MYWHKFNAQILVYIEPIERAGHSKLWVVGSMPITPPARYQQTLHPQVGAQVISIQGYPIPDSNEPSKYYQSVRFFRSWRQYAHHIRVPSRRRSLHQNKVQIG